MEALWTGMAKIAKYIANVSFQKGKKPEEWLRGPCFKIHQVSILSLLGYDQGEE